MLFGIGVICNVGIGIFEQIVYRKCCREDPNWKFIEKGIDGLRHHLILKLITLNRFDRYLMFYMLTFRKKLNCRKLNK